MADKTKTLHAPTEVLTRGFDPALSVGSARPAVFRSSTYVFSSPEAAERAFDLMAGRARKQADEEVDLVYSRFNHPNAQIAEDHIVPLEKGAAASLMFNSGMAAIMTSMMTFLQPGDAVVYTVPIYGGTQHLIQDFLEPRWRQARPDAGQVLLSFRDWTQGLALRAYASGSARSLRQAERRVRQWAGLPLRELRVHSRAEQAYFNAMDAARRGDMVLAQRALEDGFADQPHMCRESRRVTGFTPAQLHDKVFHDEAFWVYRLWEHAQAPARLD